MSDRKLTILGIVAGVLLAVAVIQTKFSQTAAPTYAGPTNLVQGFGDPGGIATIQVSAESTSVTLKRQGDHFVVSDKDSYVAASKEINNLINSCLDIKRGQQITDNPENYEELGITEETARTRVTFLDGSDKEMLGVIIGDARTEGQGSYVRLTSDPEVYVAPSVPYLRTRPMDYVNKTLVEVLVDDIVRVAVTDPNGTYTLTKADGSIVLDEVGEGKQARESELKLVFESLASMECEDLQRQGSGFNFDRSFVCELKNSTIYTFLLAEKDGKTYASCSAEFADKTEVVKASTVESIEELEAKEAILLGREGALNFVRRHTGWIYELPSYRADRLTKAVSDLVEDIPAEEEETVEEGLPADPLELLSLPDGTE